MKLVIVKEEDVMHTEAFNEAFWDWFDNISPRERKVFLYYNHDMAKLYFYNKYYIKQHVVKSNESDSYLHIRI